MTDKSCPFCDPLPEDRIFYRDQLVIGLWDGFPRPTEGTKGNDAVS